MNSPLFAEWVKEEREEAAKKAAINKSRENIVDLLSARFDFVSRDIRDTIQLIEDEVLLDKLFRKAVKAETLEEFADLLKRLE